MRFSLCCDLESLDISSSGTIWGGVWIEADGEEFPEVGWNDMAVAFICELGSVLVAAEGGNLLSRRVRFYDGPFWVAIEGSRPQGFVLTLAGSRAHTVLERLPADRVVGSVSATALALLDACRGRGWAENPDVVRLAAVAASLR